MTTWNPVEIVILTIIAAAALAFLVGSFPRDEGNGMPSFGLLLLTIALWIQKYLEFRNN